jgi:thioredoxin-like negative regulator of GroEL
MKLITDADLTFPGMGGMHGGMGHKMSHRTDAQTTAMNQAHALMKAGKQTEADAVLKAAGITTPTGGTHGKGNSAAQTAFLGTLTDAQKTTLTQAMTLMRSGDKSGADAMLKSANITLPARPTHMSGMGQGRHSVTATTVTQ